MHKLFILGRAFIYFALGAVLTSQAEPPATISPTTPAPRIEKLNNLERGMMSAPVEQRLAMPKPAMNSRPQGTSLTINSADVTAVLGKERRTIRIGVEYNSPPLSYVSIPGQPEGFTVELLREVGFIAHIDFVFVQGAWVFLLEEFKAGRIDALANTLINNDRLKFMDFSIGHTALHSITFSRPENSPVTRTSQFVGKKMAALRGTQSYFGAVSNRGWGATIVPFNSYPEMLRAVKEGTCDFALAMRLLRTEFILARPSNLPPQFVEVGTTGTPRVETQPDELDLRRDFMEDIISQFHIAVHKGDANNLAVINEGLATVRANGTFDRLYTKWIGPTEPHKITLRDLRPYLWPIALGTLLIFSLFFWQQAHSRALGRQATALIKSEADLRRTNMLGRIGGWELDLKTRKYSWSEQIFHINELDPTGPVPTADSGLYDGYTNANRAYVSEAIARCTTEGLAFDLEVEKTTSQGRPIWVRIQGSPLRVGSVIVKLVGILQDITARKQSETLFRLKNAALEASAEGILITDRQGIIVWANPAFTAMTGYHRDEVIGRNPSFLKSGIHNLAFYQNIWATILRGDTWHDELISRHKDGRLITDRQSMSPVTDSSGNITHFVNIRWDISEEKRMTKQLELLQIQNQQLQKAESLSRMAGAIAHHFNNQLQGIMGNLELLKRGSKEEARAAYVLAAETHALKAAEISGLMLTYLGESTAERGPLDLAEVGAETLHLLSAVAPAGIVLKGDFAPTGPTIMANGKQIYQILSSLVTNAWEASPLGSATIHVSIQPAVGQSISSVNRVPANWQPSAETYACLQVTDTGRGIAPLDLPNIYDPFYTVHKEGRGLGLSAVLGLVRSYQGAITVESVVGSGTTFRVFLPISAIPLAAAAKTPLRPGAPARLGRAILIVEDDASLRSTVKLALEIADYVVLEAADGVEAVAIFTAHQATIGCVLCDVMMPRMNGWETLTALRELAPELPVIIASGYSEVHLKTELVSQPTHLFLQKPYALADLTHMLRSILS